MSKHNKPKKPKTGGAKKKDVVERSEPENAASGSISRSESLASVTTNASALSKHVSKITKEENREDNLEEYAELYGPSIVDIEGTEYVLSDDYKINCVSSYYMARLEHFGPDDVGEKPAPFTMHDIIKAVNKKFPIKDECRILHADMEAEGLPFSTTTKKRKASTSDNDSVASFKTQNSYEALENDCSVTQQTEPEKDVTAPRFKPKPIMVLHIAKEKLREFTKFLSNQGDFGFEVKPAGRYTSIFPDTSDDKTAIAKVLKAGNFQYYLVPDRTRLYKAVITGMESVDPAEIKEELVARGFDVVQVSQMKSRRDGRMLPLYLVQLIKSRKAKDIHEVKSLFRIRIKVEHFKAQNKATQCYRCQNWNHVAENCHIEPQCAGCTGNHETRDCPNKKLSEETRPPPKCCHCGEEHPSSWKGCKMFPDRKTYSQALKGKPKAIKTKDNAKTQQTAKPNLPKVTQARPQRVEPKPIYNPDELQSDFTRLVQIIAQIKTELQIDSFADMVKSLEVSLHSIQAATNPTSKKLAFLDGLTNLTRPDQSGSGSTE